MDLLECLFCAQTHMLNVFNPFCPTCGQPLLSAASQKGRSFRFDRKLAIEVFQDYFPLKKIVPDKSLGEGDTPLTELGRLRAKFGLPRIFAKNETMNPTASFKDRGTIVAVHKALELGFGRIGTISTGNMAGSTAAYAAKAGLDSIIFVKEDTTQEKILAAGLYGPILIKVRGDYGTLFRKSFDIGRTHGIYFMNSVDPFRIEGYKATGYEIFLQLGDSAPDYVFVPVSAGGHLIGLMRAFLDLKADGLVSRLPVFVGVQAMGCAPLVRAYDRGRPDFMPFSSPRTVAHAISNPNPPGGKLALKMIREANGLFLSISDAEILKAQRLLADHEGLLCDPASATVFAGVLKLSRRGIFKNRDRLVLVITGSGLKTLDVLNAAALAYRETSIEDLEKTMASVLS